MDAHLTTLHGGVGMTMTKVRELYWVPRLRKLFRQMVKSCHGCRRFRAKAYASPPPGLLPTDRTQGDTPYQVVGIDYAGPIKYRRTSKTQSKAYVVLYACSLTRGLFLDLVPDMEKDTFLGSLKHFIARRGRPKKIYSDNAKTFVGAAKWVKLVMHDERIQGYLTQQGIKWQFNLSRAPWWGGQFERMVGLVKTALYKTIGNGMLSWLELKEVILDVEVALNNRPLSYVEDDVQLPTLTPNSFLYGGANALPQLEPHHEPDQDLRNRARYLAKCKTALWSRWTKEYLRSLREQHRLKAEAKNQFPNKGDVVIIKSDEKNRGKWSLGIVEEQIVGKDGVIRGARLRSGQSFKERPIQHLYPLELSCARTALPPQQQLNPQAATFRPRRYAAVAAGLRVQDIARNEDED